MEFTTIARAKKQTGLSYLGSVSKTVKHKKSLKYGEMTYSLYLSPANTSGYEVCPGRTAECTRFCLNESGMNKMVQNNRGDVINASRIKKTRLFFEHREFFMKWMIAEISTANRKAQDLGYTFSVRLNNTSDISPLDFRLGEENILEIFPNTKFYDYTKVRDRISLPKKYPNYDLTFSYTGHNWNTCQEMLKSKINVAVVFKAVPASYNLYKVIDGDRYDMRYMDKKGVIVGLKFKQVRNKLNSNVKFVVQ